MEARVSDQLISQVTPKPAQLKIAQPKEQRILGLTGDFERIPVDSLNVDPRYQRKVSSRHIARIAKDYDDDLLGVILVSEREDGLRYILDGMHRVEAVRSLGMNDALVPALVYRRLSEEREAKIFADLNQVRLYITPQEAFRAQLMAGEPEAVKLKATAERYGYHLNYWRKRDQEPEDAVPMGRKEGQLSAIGTMKKVTTDFADSQMLDKVLMVLRDAYTNEAIGIQSGHIHGVAIFLYNFQDLMERPRLIEVMEKTSVARLLEDARERYKSKEAYAVARILLDRYNYHRAGRNKLPEGQFRKAK